MELAAILEALRLAYLAEFEATYAAQVEIHGQVKPEVAFQVSQEGLYNGIFVVDLLTQDSGVLEVGVGDASYVGPASAMADGMRVEIGRVSWDALRFTPEPSLDALPGFDRWFETWINLDGDLSDPDALTANMIHSAWLGTGWIDIDFGTASVDAAVELLGLFEAAGTNAVTVSSARP